MRWITEFTFLSMRPLPLSSVLSLFLPQDRVQLAGAAQDAGCIRCDLWHGERGSAATHVRQHWQTQGHMETYLHTSNHHYSPVHTCPMRVFHRSGEELPSLLEVVMSPPMLQVGLWHSSGIVIITSESVRQDFP